jgi:hypothetical protein
MKNDIDNAERFLTKQGITKGITFKKSGAVIPSLPELLISYASAVAGEERNPLQGEFALPDNAGGKHQFILSWILKLGIDHDGYKEIIRDLSERLVENKRGELKVAAKQYWEQHSVYSGVVFLNPIDVMIGFTIHCIDCLFSSPENKPKEEGEK